MHHSNRYKVATDGADGVKEVFNVQREYEIKLQQKDGQSETQSGGIRLSQIDLYSPWNIRKQLSKL